MEDSGKRYNALKDKSVLFSIRIIKLYKYLTDNKKEYVMAKQLLRSGTSIGANISEAIFAESNADYIHKYAISQKECSETLYWLTILQETEYLTKEEYVSMNDDCIELLKLLTSTIVTLKKKTSSN